jgi:hypothetical protein
MTTTTKHLTGNELLAALEATGLDKQVGATGVFDTHDEAIMAEAHKVLLDNGCYLYQSAMDERHYYRQSFISTDGWPGHFDLRFIANGVSYPQLVLAYRQETETVIYRRSPRRITATWGTGTSESEKMIFEFKKDMPEKRYFWLPVFEGSPLTEF